jgi:iron complex transport system substrate-binding protein
MPNLLPVFQKLIPKRHRRWKLLALAVLSAGLVAACNGASSDGSAQYTSANVHPDQLTHTVEHAMGKTQVPKNPQRIVTLGNFTTESLLAIDLHPIGTLTPQSSYLKKRLQDTKSIGYPRPDLERVLALQPDLILGTTYLEEIYAQASQIAPTVLFEFQTSANWKEIFASVGKAVRRSEKVNAVMKAYRDRLATFQEKMGDPNNLEVSVVRIYPDRLELYQQNTFPGTILADAGLSRPPSQRGERFSKSISKEQLQLADGDVIFVWTNENNFQNEREAQMAIEQLQDDRLWSKLEAVQQDQIYAVNGNYWIGSGPIAANLVVDDLFRYLVEEES